MLLENLSKFQSVEDAASEMAGNWMKWQNYFWPESQRPPDSERLLVGYLVNNEGGFRQERNLQMVREFLAPHIGAGQARIGTADFYGDKDLLTGVSVPVYDEAGGITQAFRTLYNLAVEMVPFNDFLDGYLDALLLYERYDDEYLDFNYDPNNIEVDTMRKIERECRTFIIRNKEDLDEVVRLEAEGSWNLPKHVKRSVMGHAGFDFYLTRQHHGCGFWDGDWPEEIGDRLTESAHKFGEFWIEVSGGKIYVC